MDVAGTPSEAQDRLAELSAAGWLVAAIGAAVETGVVEQLGEPCSAATLAARTGLPAALAARLAEALVAARLASRTADGFVAAPGLTELWRRDGGAYLRADLRSGLLQSAALFASALDGSLQTGWSYTDERVLQAQGTMSAGAVAMLERHLLPALGDVVERLDSGGAFLDVGAGVGAVTIAFCRAHPAMTAVGLEPAAAPLELARRNVAAAGMSDRIELRRQLVEDLDDVERFDLAWLPGNFLPPDVLPAAFAAVHRALRPGGWLLNGTLGSGDDGPRATAGRLRAVLWGGDLVTPEHIVELLEASGFAGVRLLAPTPAGLVPIVARRP